MNKKIWYILIGIALVILGIAVYFIFRPTAAPKPSENPAPANASVTPPYNPSQMTEDESMLLLGRIVVEALGTYQSQDPFFRNLLSVQSYVTAEFYSRLQAIIDRGIDERVPPFALSTQVVSRQIASRGVLKVQAAYEVVVTRSDQTAPASKTIIVDFVRIGPRWYVDNSSQIK